MASVAQTNNQARETIIGSIRAHLAESARLPANDSQVATFAKVANFAPSANGDLSPVAMFRERLESVGGHCVVVRDEDEARQALTEIIRELRAQNARLRVALSDAPIVFALAQHLDAEEITVNPLPSDLFNYDVGITTAQAAIAETGTLVLEAEKERHRLVSLLPPVHIAVIKAEDFCSTIGQALDRLHRDVAASLSRAISFITGPSRTADIELTLTVGVHGPKELYVIVVES